MFSCLLVTYNSFFEIESCLNALSNCLSLKSELIIIDNASNDKTLEILKKNFPQVKLIQNKINIGFGKACNQGARVAKGEYLLFLNPDTVVKPHTIEKMVKFIEGKKDVAVAGCKILNPDNSLQPSCGNFPTILNIILDRIPVFNKMFPTELIRQESYYQKKQFPDWISGAFFLVKKEIFLKLGGFDGKYFMYVEDIDFCYRAQKAGYKIYYNPNAEIIHYDMGKSKERKFLKAKNMRKGLSIFFKKYKSPLYYSLWQTILRMEVLLNKVIPYRKFRTFVIPCPSVMRSSGSKDLTRNLYK